MIVLQRIVPAPVQLIAETRDAPMKAIPADQLPDPDPAATMRVSIAALMVVSAAISMPQKLIAGKSWGCCNLSQFPELSGVPYLLVAPALRWATMARYVEHKIEAPYRGCTRLSLYATREGLEAVDSALSVLSVVHARW